MSDAEIVLNAIMTKICSQEETSWAEVKEAVHSSGGKLDWLSVQELIKEAIAEGLIKKNETFWGKETYFRGDEKKQPKLFGFFD